MGVVYKARQKSLNRLVALKLLAPERVQDAKFAERFTREAQALAALNHPNIVTVYDFGQAGGFYFLLMEFVDGVNLRQLLRARKLAPAEALAVVPPICEALQRARALRRPPRPQAGQPAAARSGRVKIAGFGIAKMLGAGRRASVVESQIIGTPQYGPRACGASESNHRATSTLSVVVLRDAHRRTARHATPAARKVQIDVRLDECAARSRKPRAASTKRRQIFALPAGPWSATPTPRSNRAVARTAPRCSR